MIAPCPDGWREVAGLEGVAECDPWPATGQQGACAFGEAHFVGTPGCARVGTTCPADGWPEGLPTGRPIVFVDDDAAAGGNGTTRATAFSSIAVAVGSAPANAVIAIAAGSYDEIVPVGPGQTLWGACVADTQLTSSVPDSNATVVGLTGAGAGVRNLSFAFPERTAIVIAAADTTIDDVVIRDARVVAISVTSGSVTARGVVVNGTRERVEDGLFGNGISVAPGATLTLERALIEYNRNGGIGLAGGTATVRSTVLAGTFPQASDGRYGHGLAAAAGSTAVLEECAIERNAAEGVFVNGAGANVEIRRSVIRDTFAQDSNDQFGRGADVLGGASLALVRTLVSENLMGGVFAMNAELTLTDVVVRDTGAQALDGKYGFGAHVDDGGNVTLSRVLFAQNRMSGVFVAGGTVTGADLTVVDTQPQMNDDLFGRGIHASEAGSIDLDRVLLARNREVGLSAVGAGTNVAMTHLRISDTRPQAATEIFGGGISAEEGATITIDVSRIEMARVFGVRALEAASITLTEHSIAGIESNAAPPSGFGLVAQAASLNVTHFAIDDIALCAYLLGDGASVDLMQGDVSSVPTGACLQGGTYDTDRLHDDVFYVGATPEAPTTHVLPDALPTLQ